MSSINHIWSNPFNLLKFWCIKYAEDPAKLRTFDVEKDSYERLDSYDGQGVAVFTYLNFRKQIERVFSADI